MPYSCSDLSDVTSACADTTAQFFCPLPKTPQEINQPGNSQTSSLPRTSKNVQLDLVCHSFVSQRSRPLSVFRPGYGTVQRQLQFPAYWSPTPIALIIGRSSLVLQQLWPRPN